MTPREKLIEEAHEEVRQKIYKHLNITEDNDSWLYELKHVPVNIEGFGFTDLEDLLAIMNFSNSIEPLDEDLLKSWFPFQNQETFEKELKVLLKKYSIDKEYNLKTYDLTKYIISIIDSLKQLNINKRV